MQVRSALSVVVVTALLTALGSAPAQADGARTLTGPSTGDADVFLTYVGCGSVFTPGTAPQSRLNIGPYDAPLGRRSLGLVPSTPGSASGPFARFQSLASFDSSLSVAATSGGQGVSYVMSITASNPPGTAWSGRAALSVPAGSWTAVSTAALTYDWTLVDLTTLDPVSEAGAATTAAFAAEHGDGSGFAVIGFGCDGKAFNLDAVSAAGSTFDFEGIALSTDATADRPRATAGDQVSISGRVTDAHGRVTGDPLVLEHRTPGGAWISTGTIVMPNPGGLSRVDAPVSETTEFRWHRPESQYADEGWSDPVTVTVDPPAASAEPETTPEPGTAPAPETNPAPETTPAQDTNTAPETTPEKKSEKK